MDDVDAMIAEKDQLQEEVDTIKHQLDMATATYHETGERTDPIWFQKATHAMRCKQRDVQKLARKIAKARKGNRAQHGNELGNIFIDVARETLPQEQFQRILQTAQGRVMNMESDDD